MRAMPEQVAGYTVKVSLQSQSTLLRFISQRETLFGPEQSGISLNTIMEVIVVENSSQMTTIP